MYSNNTQQDNAGFNPKFPNVVNRNGANENETKTIFLSYAPFFSSPMSVVGSGLIILCIMRHQRGKRSSVYHRILIGMSCLDILFSTAYAFGSTPKPPPDPEWSTIFGNKADLLAMGNTTTCAVQAFFVQFGFMSYSYSACLCIYFVLAIRYNVKEALLARYVEPIMHTVVLSFVLFTAICAQVKGYANENIPVCWVGTSPPLCDVLPNIQCIRGESYRDFVRWAITYPVWIESGSIFACLLTVMWTVIEKRKSSARFVFQEQGNTVTSVIQRQTSRTFDAQTRSVVVQCLLYCFSFTNGIFWQTFQLTLQFRKTEGLFQQWFFVVALSIILFPLQGFFNFIVFIRPGYLHMRSQYPERSRWTSLKYAIWDPCRRRRTSLSASQRATRPFDNVPNVSVNLPKPRQESRIEDPTCGTQEDSGEVNMPGETDQDDNTWWTVI